MLSLQKANAIAEGQPKGIVERSHNTPICGSRSLIALRPNISNELPQNTKSETSFNKFMKYIKLWC